MRQKFKFRKGQKVIGSWNGVYTKYGEVYTVLKVKKDNLEILESDSDSPKSFFVPFSKLRYALMMGKKYGNGSSTDTL